MGLRRVSFLRRLCWLWQLQMRTEWSEVPAHEAPKSVRHAASGGGAWCSVFPANRALGSLAHIWLACFFPRSSAAACLLSLARFLCRCCHARFGVMSSIRLNPLSGAKDYTAGEPFKLSFSFSGERLLVPWITITDGRNHRLQTINFYFKTGQGFLLNVRWHATCQFHTRHARCAFFSSRADVAAVVRRTSNIARRHTPAPLSLTASVWSLCVVPRLLLLLHFSSPRPLSSRSQITPTPPPQPPMV